jgi:hypothetical protein
MRRAMVGGFKIVTGDSPATRIENAGRLQRQSSPKS